MVFMISDCSVVEHFRLFTPRGIVASVANIRRFQKQRTGHFFVAAERFYETMVTDLLGNGSPIFLDAVSNGGERVAVGQEFLNHASVPVGKVKVLFQIFLLILFHGGLLSIHAHITKIIIAERTVSP